MSQLIKLNFKYGHHTELKLKHLARSIETKIITGSFLMYHIYKLNFKPNPNIIIYSSNLLNSSFVFADSH